MAENPIETVANELKKWLELLEKYLNKMEADKLAKDSAKLTADRHQEMVKELKGIKEKLGKCPDGPDKDTVAKKVEGAEKKLSDSAPNKQDLKQEVKGPDKADVKLGEAKGLEAKVGGPDVKLNMPRKQSTGEALGWTKGEKGWQNKEGVSVKELGSKVKMPAAGAVGIK